MPDRVGVFSMEKISGVQGAVPYNTAGINRVSRNITHDLHYCIGRVIMVKGDTMAARGCIINGGFQSGVN